jgi:DNA invertase Pin-like site-specific DNA recombinase
MLIGYARVSTIDQETSLQLDALRTAGAIRIFEERLSAVMKRPELERMLYCLRRGDVVLVYKVDRLARSLADLLRIIERIERAGATFRSLTEPIETGTPIGRLITQLLGSFAEFERSVIRERCAAGTKAAKARGVQWGRPRRLDWESAVQMSGSGATPYEIGELFGVHHTTVRLALKTLKNKRLQQADSSKEDFTRSHPRQGYRPEQHP